VIRLDGLRHAVVDASAVVDFLLHPANHPTLARLVGRLDVELHAPMFCDVEVLAGVRRTLLNGLSSPTEARSLLEDFLDLPLERYPHEPLLSRILDLYENFTTYDAAYVALAEALGIPLLTNDARLATATRTHTDVEVLTT